MQEQLTAIQKILDTAIAFLVSYSFQILGALIVLVAGVMAARWAGNGIFALLQKRKLDVTLSKFIAGFVKTTLIVFTVLIALGNFGITIAPFLAVLGAATFGLSFAIQGPLSNYGAGLSLILTRPFVVGDTITVAGVSGVVEDVKLACTVLTDEDGVRITIPNRHIVGEVLHNSRTFKIVPGVVGISYGDDPAKAIRAIREALEKNPEVAKEPKPQVGVQEFSDSSVNIGFRYWVPTSKYYQASYAVNLAVFQAVQAAGLTIPFPQRDIHVISQPAAGKENPLALPRQAGLTPETITSAD